MVGGGGRERGGSLISQNGELCRFFKNWPGNGINSPYRTRKQNGKAQASEVGDHAVEEKSELPARELRCYNIDQLIQSIIYKFGSEE